MCGKYNTNDKNPVAITFFGGTNIPEEYYRPVTSDPGGSKSEKSRS